jgi:hypothetical protein
MPVLPGRTACWEFVRFLDTYQRSLVEDNLSTLVVGLRSQVRTCWKLFLFLFYYILSSSQLGNCNDRHPSLHVAVDHAGRRSVAGENPLAFQTEIMSRGSIAALAARVLRGGAGTSGGGAIQLTCRSVPQPPTVRTAATTIGSQASSLFINA